MSDNRKYYYLKLKENYFDDDSIVLLDRILERCARFFLTGRISWKKMLVLPDRQQKTL